RKLIAAQINESKNLRFIASSPYPYTLCGHTDPLRHDATQRSKLHESNWQIAIRLFGRPMRAIGSALFDSIRCQNAARRESLQAPAKKWAVTFVIHRPLPTTC
ncbi:MAG TPA: hypothetical protein VIC84_23590, partial [Blastocatellia bacterium]